MKARYVKCLPTALICLSIAAQAQAEDITPTLEIANLEQDAPHQDEYEQYSADVTKLGSIQTDEPNTASDTAVTLTKDALLEQPDVIIRAIIAALLQNNGDSVKRLLPYYEALPIELHDEVIENWAKAIVARDNHQLSQAIRHYRRALSAQPDLLQVRLQLATTLFANKEWEAAEDQFYKLRSEQALPVKIITHIDNYLQAIREQNYWAFYGGVTYIHDTSINNAPKQSDLGGGWHASKPESGEGLGFHMGANKKWALKDGLFGEFRLSSQGKYYWNNKRYNEISARASAGIGYQDAKRTISVLPFAEQTWYAGGNKNSESLQNFSDGAGVAIEGSYWFHPQWQGSAYVEANKQNYRTRKHLEGNNYFTSATVFYRPNAKQSWFIGVDYSDNRAKDKDSAFVRHGVRLGWNNEWKQGISTRISAGFAHKNYQEAGFFSQVQKNKETNLQASVWSRNLHFGGITPRLTWSYQDVKSNIPLYTYDKQRVFVEFSKQF